MGSGGVAIAALPTVICLKVPFSDGLGGAKIHLSHNVKIMPQAMLVSLRGGIIEIGANTEISMYSRVASMGYVKVGNHVLTGPHVFIADYNHEY